jgi:hypothetical protein
LSGGFDFPVSEEDAEESVFLVLDTREPPRQRRRRRGIRRHLLLLGVGAALFASVVYAAGELPRVGGPPWQWVHLPGDTDGVSVTYQDPDNDGDYERVTVGDIDLSGRHTTSVRIVDLEPFERVLASGQRTTSGKTSIITLSNALLASEIEDADLVTVTLRRAR